MSYKFFGGIAVAIVAVAMALNVNFNAKNDSLSDVSLANVEALANMQANGCTLNVLQICTTIHGDHYLYRNN